jgi:hypothetical protein
MAGLQRLVQVKGRFGTAPLVRTTPIYQGSAQTFVEGDLLMLNGNGGLQIVTSTGGTVSGNIPAGIKLAGIAMSPAQLTTVSGVGTQTQQYLSDQYTQWEPGILIAMPLTYVGTVANAVWNTNLLGGSYEVNYSNGYPMVDIGHTTNAYVKIVDVFAEDVPGWPGVIGAGTVQYPWVWVTPISTTCVFF